MSLGTILLVAGSANFSTRDVWDGYRVALQEQGWNVIPYSTFAFLRMLSVDAVCNDIIGTAVDEANQIDYVVFVDGLYFRGQRARVPKSIRRAGIKTVLIATDDPYVSITHAETFYDFRFSNEIRSATDGVVYLPTATLVPPEVPKRSDPTYAISFLGTVFEDRVETLVRVAQYCEQHQLRFLVAGKLLGDAKAFDRFEWTDVIIGTIDDQRKWQIYSDSILTLNVFRSSSHPAESPSPRIYEVTAFGHAALVNGPRRSEVDALYGDSVFTFDNLPNDAPGSIESVIETALGNAAERSRRIEQARSVTLAGQTYLHRAETLTNHLHHSFADESSRQFLESRVAWIIGCGRTGSTWLAEMLGDFPGMRRWHEPYFGRVFRHVYERPEELERAASFFNKNYEQSWLGGIRELFFSVAQQRFPQLGNHALFVKEVNTVELYPWLRALFPQSPVVLLVRDPFDVLDSYIDLQLPGSWNEKFREPGLDATELENVRRTAEHISKSIAAALAVFDSTPERQRLWITYESLLDDPQSCLRQCAGLMGVELDPARVGEVIQTHQFANYKQTGRKSFRRHGTAGGWSTSPNFNDDVRHIANDVLGHVRVRLGYETDQVVQS